MKRQQKLIYQTRCEYRWMTGSSTWKQDCRFGKLTVGAGLADLPRTSWCGSEEQSTARLADLDASRGIGRNLRQLLSREASAIAYVFPGSYDMKF